MVEVDLGKLLKKEFGSNVASSEEEGAYILNELRPQLEVAIGQNIPIVVNLTNVRGLTPDFIKASFGRFVEEKREKGESFTDKDFSRYIKLTFDDSHHPIMGRMMQNNISRFKP